jgi:hypothetical protein
VKQLNTQENNGVVRELEGLPRARAWIIQSLEENRAELEILTEPVYIYRLQGENRVLNKILDKMPEDG